jgi:hypothetical protein
MGSIVLLDLMGGVALLLFESVSTDTKQTGSPTLLSSTLSIVTPVTSKPSFFALGF